MSDFVTLVLAALVGYLIGAIPSGYILVKLLKGVDLREIGSGRTGGTNAYRAAGVPVGFTTAVLDVLKGACAVWAVRALFADSISSDFLPWIEVVAGVFSVVGHNWSVYIGWKGGAGTGPNVGWAGAIWLPIVPVAFITVAAIMVGLGIASIASMAMAIAVPVAFIALYAAGIEPYDATIAYIVGGIVGAAVILWSLRPNIRRLLAGNEFLVGPRRSRKKNQESEADIEN
ncbi:MAG: glycerol-3-phosphate acyltransferase [Candidatus Promineifilaceae bacterium]